MALKIIAVFHGLKFLVKHSVQLGMLGMVLQAGKKKGTFPSTPPPSNGKDFKLRVWFSSGIVL
jgi:hypothetical protein